MLLIQNYFLRLCSLTQPRDEARTDFVPNLFSSSHIQIWPARWPGCQRRSDQHLKTWFTQISFGCKRGKESYSKELYKHLHLRRVGQFPRYRRGEYNVHVPEAARIQYVRVNDKRCWMKFTGKYEIVKSHVIINRHNNISLEIAN